MHITTHGIFSLTSDNDFSYLLNERDGEHLLLAHDELNGDCGAAFFLGEIAEKNGQDTLALDYYTRAAFTYRKAVLRLAQAFRYGELTLEKDEPRADSYEAFAQEQDSVADGPVDFDDWLTERAFNAQKYFEDHLPADLRAKIPATIRPGFFKTLKRNEIGGRSVIVVNAGKKLATHLNDDAKKFMSNKNIKRQQMVFDPPLSRIEDGSPMKLVYHAHLANGDGKNGQRVVIKIIATLTFEEEQSN